MREASRHPLMGYPHLSVLYMTHNSMEEKFRSAKPFGSFGINFSDPELFLYVGSRSNVNLFEDLGVHHPLIWLEVAWERIAWK
jgi:hypothetical protein